MTEAQRQQINAYIYGIAQGRESDLDHLFFALSGRMMSIAMSVLHNHSLAQDALQDSFVKIVQKAKSFTPNTNGYAWVCKIVQNCALNVLRREKRHRSVNIEDCFNLASADDVFQSATQSATLYQAMAALTKIEQVLVYQRYFMDYTIRDSAKALGKSKSAVARLIQTAEQKLKTFLTSGTNDEN